MSPAWVFVPLVLLLLAGGATWLAVWRDSDDRGDGASKPGDGESLGAEGTSHDTVSGFYGPVRHTGRRKGGRAGPTPRISPSESARPPVLDDLVFPFPSAGGEAAAVASGALDEVEAEALRKMRGEAAERSGSRRNAGTIGIRGRAGGTHAAKPLEARVVDAVDGTAIAGAEVLSIATRDRGRVLRGFAVLSDEEGHFSIRALPRAANTAEVVIRARGYRSLRTPFEGAPRTFRLEPSDGPGFGTMRGRVTNAAGHGLHGMLFVDLRSDVGEKLTVYVWSDVSGHFTVEGLTPGTWFASHDDTEAGTPVVIPDGGEGAITIRGSRPDAPAPPVPGADRRTVHVTGAADDTVLRAEGGVNMAWLAVVKDGVATFELPFGIWVLRRTAPGAKPQPLRVEEGAGPLDVALTE